MSPLSYFSGKRIFISGVTGFKGTWLCHILRIAGAEVFGYALPPSAAYGKMPFFLQTGTDRDITLTTGDVRDEQKFRTALKDAKPDTVFHLAAQPLVRLSYRESRTTFEVNVMGTVNLFEAVRACPSVSSVVNVTTDKVYENRETMRPYREDDMPGGFDPYSTSKACSELVTASYRRAFFDEPSAPALSSARSGNVIGGGDYSEDRIIPDCVRAAEEGRTVIVRNPHSIRPYQHVLDCLFGYLLLAEKQCGDRNIAGAYNFGPDDSCCVSTGDLAGIFSKLWGEGVSWKTENDGGPHEAAYLKLDATKARQNLNWQSRRTIEEATAMTVEYEKTPQKERRKILERQINDYFSGNTK